jgi:hypothetical protein
VYSSSDDSSKKFFFKKYFDLPFKFSIKFLSKDPLFKVEDSYVSSNSS